MDKKRLVIGISGASGATIGIKLLKLLKEISDWETHLIISQGAEETIRLETSHSLEEVKKLADKVYKLHNMAANISSGSYKTDGMVILPCSMKTVAGIASGYTDNLLIRAADVTIKEKRKLVLGIRETPLSPIHLKNMSYLADIGTIIMPLMLTYYNKPKSIDDMGMHMVGKILDVFGIEIKDYKRWSND